MISLFNGIDLQPFLKIRILIEMDLILTQYSYSHTLSLYPVAKAHHDFLILF